MKTRSKLFVSTALAFVGGFTSAMMLRSEPGKRTVRRMVDRSHAAGDAVRDRLQRLEDTCVPHLPDSWTLSDSDVMMTLGNAIR